ncbi:Penicillin-binding protein [Colletotrichum higginsianum IMI 349063]|uniref:Penicillin-binding protein n=2 Tax=Colletotrichum higginsianum TaxID=80884 RepID=A0A1B7YR40_COLHI|nr:Penicillin-binding protein [Colletotrichum higginsianum IMI 349063]OBR14422.1 Penicillin-binding protein [Colletotrichum higginsianum IMI 349063]TID02518.1 Protein flp [Colletotrichum higginsianum]
MHPHSFLGLLASCLLLFFSAAAVVVAVPIAIDTSADVHTYFDLDGAAHDEKVKSLTTDGYRIISLSVYGTPPNANYAAVWVRREGPAFEAIHGVDEAAYDTWLDSWRNRGYVSTHISATGPARSAVFAGVVEQRTDVASWEQRCGLTDPMTYDNATSGVDMVVRDFRMYGGPGNRLYCVLGHENVGNQLSTIFYSAGDDALIDYPAVYASETAKRFWRPSRLFVSDDHVITPQFVDTSVGKWVALYGLTAAELSAQIETQKQQGLHPIDLHGGGGGGGGGGGVSGSDTRFTVIFAETDIPEARKWTATGSVTGFGDNSGATAALDGVMQAWMRKNGVRQAQLAIARNGSTVAERGYTWAEADRAVVEPDDVFLLASVSKLFLHAAVSHLVGAGRLNYSTAVYPLLGYKPADARANDITVDHLLQHTAGYSREQSGDPAFQFRNVSLGLLNGARAATLPDVIEYQVARPLDFAPGSDYSYSNYGTMLLSHLVSNLTAVPYMTFLRDVVLGDSYDVRLYETAASVHKTDRIVQESRFTGREPTDPGSDRLVPGPHGGDGAIKEECAGAFSLAASASTVARFIGAHAVAGMGGRIPNAERDGTLVGARASAASRSDVDWALMLNTREFISEAEFDDLRFQKIPSVLDRFPVAP